MDDVMDEFFSSDKTMQQKKKEYVESFTIHGLSKIFTGTKIESIFWSCVVLVGIFISSITIHGLVSKYYNYEIYTDVSVRVTNKNMFPSITFCDQRLLKDDYFAYCGVPLSKQHGSPNEPCGTLPIERNETVNHNQNHNHTHPENNKWSNGLFNVRECYTWGSKICTNDKYLKSLSRHNNTCFTWNWNGDLYDAYSHAYIEFEMNQTSNILYSPYMIAIVHDPKVLELEMTNKVIIEPSKEYELKISKTVLKRLPSPFPSNCTDERKADIFPGAYTRRTCIESINYVTMLIRCGDVMDYHKRIMPQELLDMYIDKNQSIHSALECMWKHSELELPDFSDECPVPCEEVELYTMATFNEVGKGNEEVAEKENGGINNNSGNKTSLYRVHVQYQNVDAYKVFSERQLHSWDQIAGEVGGFLGLVIGASFISVIEIMAYFVLCVLQRLVHGTEAKFLQLSESRKHSHTL